jgi:cyclophilin family peptidyl-prolyl cis-trans isomerase/HEAT repeat protein
MEAASRLRLLPLLGLLAFGASCANDTKSLAGPAGERLGLAFISQAELLGEPSPAVRALLDDRSLETRVRAALAAGRIGDLSAAPWLAKLLEHDGEDGAMAAWALGRLHGEVDPGKPAPLDLKASEAELALVNCLKTQCPQEAAAARALGTSARSDETIRQLTLELERPAKFAAQAALSLGIIARIGGKGADAKIAASARALLWRTLERPESEARRGAAYALGRISRDGTPDVKPPAPDPAKPGPPIAPSVPPPLLAERKAVLVAALRDPDPETRAAVARAAGKQGLPAEELAQLLRDEDWRVRVEAARALALAPHGAAIIIPALRAAAAELAAAKEMSKASLAHPLTELLASAATLKIPRDQIPGPDSLTGPSLASTIAVRCAAAEARDRVANELDETEACSGGSEAPWRSRFRTANLVGDLAGDETNRPAGLTLIALLHDTDPRVRSAAAGNASPAFAAQLLERLDDPDPYVVTSAAGSLAKDPAIARASIPDARRALQRLAAYRDASAGDPRLDAITALHELIAAAAGSEKPAIHTPPAVHVSPAAQAGLPGRGPRPKTLILVTTVGELRVRLFTHDDETPLTAAALASLANQGFYDNLYWHRVVPDFVAQGGDPLGDGEGGPGWALPDEHTPIPFSRGSLGIATSGPGTGGSQIFFCHSAQPHLDGRYTVAGQLESGEAVMDALVIGDRILSARAE